MQNGQTRSEVWTNDAIAPSKVNETVEHDRVLLTAAMLLVKPAAPRRGERGNERNVIPVPHPIRLQTEVLNEVHSREHIQREAVFGLI